MRTGANPRRMRERTRSGYGPNPDRRGTYRAARLRMASLTPPELRRGDHLLANERPPRLLRGGRLTGSLKPARGLQGSRAPRERPTRQWRTWALLRRQKKAIEITSFEAHLRDGGARGPEDSGYGISGKLTKFPRFRAKPHDPRQAARSGRRGVADTSEPRAFVLIRSWRCDFVSRVRLVALLSGASFQAFLEHSSSRASTRNAAIQTSVFRLLAQIILVPQEQPCKRPFLLARADASNG